MASGRNNVQASGDSSSGVPTNISVGLWDIAVVQDDSALLAISNAMGAVVQAFCDTQEQKIHIRQSEHVGRDTLAGDLMHEVVHAIFRSAGVEHNDDRHEDDVEVVAKGIVEVMKRNPDLVKFITGG